MNPTAARNLARVQPSYQHISAGGDDSALLLRGTLLYHSLFIPGLPAPSGFYSLFRVDVPMESLHSQSTSAAGLQDIDLLDLAVRRFNWGAVALGIGIVVPAASNEALG